MRIAKYEYRGMTGYGLIEGDRLEPVKGGLFDGLNKTGESLALSEVRLLAPTEPSKIVCIGQNFREHIKEIGAEVPDEPVVFLKPPSCLIGPDDPIVIPRQATRVDYEGELAVVIGRRLSYVPEEQALAGVLGYTCFNDVTERDMVFAGMINLTVSKGFDTFGPCGPWIETELEPSKLQLTTRLNGQVVQDDNTADCVFSVAYLVHYASTCMTLEPGDILICGTPFGVQPMADGDVCEVEISGIGVLSNPVVGSN